MIEYEWNPSKIGGQGKKITVTDFDIQEAFRETFDDSDVISYFGLRTEIKDRLSVGKDKAMEFISLAKDEGWVRKKEESQRRMIIIRSNRPDQRNWKVPLKCKKDFILGLV